MNRLIKNARLLAILLSLWLPGLAAAQTAATPVPSAPTLGAESYILLDFNSGRVLASKNPDLRVEPASITKLMTSYVVFKELAGGTLQLEEMATISEKAWRTSGSKMFIEVGKQVSIEDLIKGMVIQSGNDASVALAEHIAGSETAFSDLMNHYGQELGMMNTHYVNSDGLPAADHYTTAADVVTLSAALIREFPDYYRWYSEKEFTFNDIRQHNRNTLLWRDPAVDGLKTGFTENAQYCLAASAKRDGMRLVSAVMGSTSSSSRSSETQSLLNYGFRFFETYQLYTGGQELASSRVWKAAEDVLPLGLSNDLFVTIPRGRYEELDAQVELQAQLEAPVSAGQIIGTLTVKLGDSEVASRSLVALNKIDEGGFLDRNLDGLRLWFDGLFEDEE